MTEYNITLELAKRNPTDDDVDALMEWFADFHPTIGTSPLGWTEVDLTIATETLRQALTIGVALGGDVVSVTGMSTAEFDRRPVDVDRVPELLSVSEAAAKLGVSRQAVLERLGSGSLAGSKVGTTWAIPAAALA